MADYRALTVVCDAVVQLLRSAYRREDFGNNTLEFLVGIVSSSTSLTSGVSLSPYRIYTNATTRTPGGRINPDGSRQKTRLPVDLHFLLTAWGKTPSVQLAVAGWMMRVLEDNPVMPPALLNAADKDVFRQDETVEIMVAEMVNEDMFRIWEKLTELPYQLSVPYVARNIRIDTPLALPQGRPVKERIFQEQPL